MKHSAYKVQLLGLVVCMLFAACGPIKETEKTETAAKNALLLINVLAPEYFADAHIPGSINVQLDELETKAAGWNKKSTVVTYCANYTCLASGDAARRLKAYGFDEVYAYEGGTAEWKKLGYPLVGKAEAGYLNFVGEESGAFDDVNVISAPDLKTLLEKAGILKTN